ncbi:MAG: glycosyltransferase [Pseudodesulfovibrio sp.]
MSPALPYTAEPVPETGAIQDLRVRVGAKTWHLWGRDGLRREADLADGVPADSLPVLLGAGLGRCLKRLAERGPVAVVDREDPIEAVTGLRAAWTNRDNVLWIAAGTPDQAFARLEAWQREHGGKPFAPVLLALYRRLDPEFYAPLHHRLDGAAVFQGKIRYPKFQSAKPRVLFFDSDYFLCREIRSALAANGAECRPLVLEGGKTGSQRFVEELLRAVVEFRPDFALTVNHLGLDREGRLAGLLADLGMPLASWFVDNPHLILHEYAHPGAENTALFTFDAGNLDLLRAKGFAHVHHLPLATDPDRFRPGLSAGAPASWAADVSFVGSSMARPVAECLEKADLLPELRDEYPAVAAAFGASGEPSVTAYLSTRRPDWADALRDLPTTENRLALESLITWEATRQYRLDCVRRILPFSPLVVGDDGWRDQIGPGGWRQLSRLDYYADLPRFYPLSKINFNCTSRQMIGAVNQRVFDVPACGGFLLTDYREQMEALFDLDDEAVVFRRPDEIPDLVRSLLADGQRRKRIAQNARRRILAEHTYTHRLATLLSVMRQTFSSPA